MHGIDCWQMIIFSICGHWMRLSMHCRVWNAGGTVLDISEHAVVRQAGFSGKVYLGVVQNAPHPERAAAYIHYLFQR